ncbi:MAG: prephenate dehydrogenase/arogenate dehydrogenase family protein [Phycisphaerae bacterium]|nr:prephenate dehydrogenase/arogenate dehydrogenase family protein [Phycisphaerae bacterium]
MLPFANITIIGVGLLGGSLGLAVKARDSAVRVVGVGRRRESLAAALARGAIDEASLDAAEAVAAAELVVLATPVGAFQGHLRTVAAALKPGAVVTDVGSTKSQVVRCAQRLLARRRSDGIAFVGSHPMAGSDRRGPESAREDLFTGATCILTPTAACRGDAVEAVDAFWQALAMRTVRMTPAAHDRAVARISHLPHALATLLMTVPGDDDLRVAASGFRDMTRLAGSDPEMWRDIFATNRKEILAALRRFQGRLDGLVQLLEAGDDVGIERLLAKSRARRHEKFPGGKQ